MSEHPFAQYVRILGKGRKAARSMDYEESQAAMLQILKGEVEEVQLGAFLMLLRIKEESAEELAGFAQATRQSLARNSQSIADIDWPSYAGKKGKLAHYILAMILLADNGKRILCHGARGHTEGRLYTEDLFLELGLSVASHLDQANTLIQKQNLCYLPLENFCLPLNNLMNLRNLFGLRSPVHSFAKLINPGNCPYILIPTFHPSYKPVHQKASLILGEKNVAVFKGDSGEAERRPNAILAVDRLTNGKEQQDKWPALIDTNSKQVTEGGAKELIKIWRTENQQEYSQQAIIGTCALALHLSQQASNQEQAIEIASELWNNRSKTLI